MEEEEGDGRQKGDRHAGAVKRASNGEDQLASGFSEQEQQSNTSLHHESAGKLRPTNVATSPAVHGQRIGCVDGLDRGEARSFCKKNPSI
jgi:hypothetical protein